MTAMLERAARALFDTYTELAYGAEGCPSVAAEEIWLEGRDGFIKSARAVLMAVREPGEYVQMKGRSVMPEHDEPLLEDAAETFAAMIDAILNEKE